MLPINEKLPKLIHILSSYVGSEYFEKLAEKLFEIIPMKYIFVGVATEDRKTISTIALTINGKLQPNFSYELMDSPCENVMKNTFCNYPNNVQALFPKDALLAQMKIESYLGCPLNDANNKTLGLMVFLDEKPIYKNFDNDKPILDILHLIVGSELSRYLSDKKLKENEEFYRLTLNSIADAVIITDTKGAIKQINHAAEVLLSTKLIDAKNGLIQDHMKIFRGENFQPIPFSVDKFIDKKQSFDHKSGVLLADKKNKYHNINYTGGPIFDENRKTIGVVIVIHDKSKEHELELQLRHNQKMEAIGQLAGGIAHDFNNILTGILGCANLLIKKSNDSKQVEYYANHIMNAAKKSSDLTRKLLDFSRKGRLSSVETDIHSIIHETLHLLDHSIHNGVKTNLNLIAKNSKIIGDPAQLQNSILNVLLNACDAMKSNGEISIESENCILNNDQLEKFELKDGNTYIKIRIRDSGPGISPDILPKIFEPFFTTKEMGKGTGLGLAAVYGSIKDHQGAIEVETELGKGTSFIFYLPLTSAYTTRSNISNLANIESSIFKKIKKVLVIEDEYLIRNSLLFLFKENNCETLAADNGQDGCILFDNNYLALDLVILDLYMPKMSGSNVYQYIREKNHNVPILFISGVNVNTNSIANNDPKIATLTKPFEESELIFSINKLLEQLS